MHCHRLSRVVVRCVCRLRLVACAVWLPRARQVAGCRASCNRHGRQCGEHGSTMHPLACIWMIHHCCWVPDVCINVRCRSMACCGPVARHASLAGRWPLDTPGADVIAQISAMLRHAVVGAVLAMCAVPKFLDLRCHVCLHGAGHTERAVHHPWNCRSHSVFRPHSSVLNI